MKVMAFNPPGLSPANARDGALLHPECPIQQTFRGADREMQRQLMGAWRHAVAFERIRFVAGCNAVTVLAPAEAGLRRVGNALRARFGSRVVADGPRVRYALQQPVLEPWMTILVSGPAAHLPRVRNDIAQRGGSVVRVGTRGNFTLEAEAPLAALIGYERWLQDLLAVEWSNSYASLWLSRYLPIDGDDPAAA